MNDLTVIFLTLNKVPEEWAKYHKQALLDSIGDMPIITISKKPMDWGLNVIQTEPESSSNIYWQMLKGAKLATTPYIAIAEDDVLYCREHFMACRPPLDTFAYNMNRWSLYTWGEPIFSYRYRVGNFALIAPRELTIEALEERFAKHPSGTPPDRTGELGKWRTEKLLGLTHRKMMAYFTVCPIIQFSHDFGTGGGQQGHKKRLSFMRAHEIPYWGRAEELVQKFKSCNKLDDNKLSDKKQEELDKYRKWGAYHWYGYDHSQSYKKFVHELKDWVRESNTLDIGAGDGFITHFLGLRRGVEINKWAIRGARKKGVNNIDFGDAHNLPYKDEEFDSVLMSNVLEHVDNPTQALKEANRVLKKYLYIAMPMKEGSFSATPEEFKKLVEDQGFVLMGDMRIIKRKNAGGGIWAKFIKDKGTQAKLIKSKGIWIKLKKIINNK